MNNFKPTDLLFLDVFSITSFAFLVSNMLTVAQYIKLRDEGHFIDYALLGACHSDIMALHHVQTKIIQSILDAAAIPDSCDILIPSAPRSQLVQFLNSKITGTNSLPCSLFYACVTAVNDKLLQCLGDTQKDYGSPDIGTVTFDKMKTWFIYIQKALEQRPFLFPDRNRHQQLVDQIGRFQEIDPSRFSIMPNNFPNFCPAVLLVGVINFVHHKIGQNLQKLYHDENPGFDDYNMSKTRFESNVGLFLSTTIGYDNFSAYNQRTPLPFIKVLPYSVLEQTLLSTRTSRTRFYRPIQLLRVALELTKTCASQKCNNQRFIPTEPTENNCIQFLEELLWSECFEKEMTRSKDRRTQYYLRKSEATSKGRNFTPNWTPCFELMVHWFGDNVSKLSPNQCIPRSLGVIRFAPQREQEIPQRNCSTLQNNRSNQQGHRV